VRGVSRPTIRLASPVIECEQRERKFAVSESRGRSEAIMRELLDVEVTVIEIDSDGDGLGDEELVIVEDTDG
jgi:hypothetical protein